MPVKNRIVPKGSFSPMGMLGYPQPSIFGPKGGSTESVYNMPYPQPPPEENPFAVALREANAQPAPAPSMSESLANRYNTPELASAGQTFDNVNGFMAYNALQNANHTFNNVDNFIAQEDAMRREVKNTNPLSYAPLENMPNARVGQITYGYKPSTIGPVMRQSLVPVTQSRNLSAIMRDQLANIRARNPNARVNAIDMGPEYVIAENPMRAPMAQRYDPVGAIAGMNMPRQSAQDIANQNAARVDAQRQQMGRNLAAEAGLGNRAAVNAYQRQLESLRNASTTMGPQEALRIQENAKNRDTEIKAQTDLAIAKGEQLASMYGADKTFALGMNKIKADAFFKALDAKTQIQVANNTSNLAILLKQADAAMGDAASRQKYMVELAKNITSVYNAVASSPNGNHEKAMKAVEGYAKAFEQNVSPGVKEAFQNVLLWRGKNPLFGAK